jgi:hypothetical protein
MHSDAQPRWALLRQRQGFADIFHPGTMKHRHERNEKRRV